MLENSYRDNFKKVIKKRNWSELKSYRIISLLTCLGKIAEKIITARLAYLAETIDLLHFNQINRRRKKSAIDIIMILIYNIQLAKQDKKVISVLFIDVKKAFNHISANQLIKICIELGLPKSLYSWINSFLINRKIQLAFNNGKSIKTDIQIGIPQGSPISPILFLIYIRNLFQDLERRGMNYINNINLVASSESIKKNCKILKKTIIRIFEKKANNLI